LTESRFQIVSRSILEGIVTTLTFRFHDDQVDVEIEDETGPAYSKPDELLKLEGERKPPSHYFRLLDQGQSVEVEGYKYSAEMWRQSLAFGLPEAMVSPNDPASRYKRPVRIVALGKNARPLVKGGVVGFEENKDFDWLFAPNYDWIVSNASVALGLR